MGRIKEISRKSAHTRKRNPVVYLICEGSETEIRYFKRFRSRGCLPASRAGLKDILREMDVPFFDPLLIIEKTKGRMAGDYQWVQMIRNIAA